MVIARERRRERGLGTSTQGISTLPGHLFLSKMSIFDKASVYIFAKSSVLFSTFAISPGIKEKGE